MALLNRVGECVRALPSFGRTRTQTAAVVAKRTLSAISTCSPSGLGEHDDLRPVLARLDATRQALRVTALTGAQRIAAARWLGQVADDSRPADADADADEPYGAPTHAYVICGGQVIRQPGDPAGADAGHDAEPLNSEEHIEDLARAGALIAAEIDRLQHHQHRRYA